MTKVIINFVIGAVFIIGGLSGRLVFRGTRNSYLIVALGVILIIYGIKLIIEKKHEEFEKEMMAENKVTENVIKPIITKVPNNTLSINIDDSTKETIKGMFVEEAYSFVSDKYNLSLKEAKKIVKEIKSKNG